MNETVNSFIDSKKLKLSLKKCCVIHVGKRTGICPELKIHGEKMHREESTKYLGDIFHTNSKSISTILEISAKAHAILADIRATLQDVPLRKYKHKLACN